MIAGMFVAHANSVQASVAPSLIIENTTSVSGNTSGSAVVSASGGNGSYTYTWSRVSGSTTINPASGSSATTAFSYSFPYDGFFSTVFKCVVEDGNGFTDEVSVTVSIYKERGSL